MEIPKVNNVDASKAEEVKAAIILGFTADPLNSGFRNVCKSWC